MEQWLHLFIYHCHYDNHHLNSDYRYDDESDRHGNKHLFSSRALSVFGSIVV